MRAEGTKKILDLNTQSNIKQSLTVGLYNLGSHICFFRQLNDKREHELWGMDCETCEVEKLAHYGSFNQPRHHREFNKLFYYWMGGPKKFMQNRWNG